MARTRRTAGGKRSAGRKRASGAKSRKAAGSRRVKSAKSRPAAGRGRGQGSRVRRPRRVVDGAETTILFIGSVPAAALEEPESESEGALRDAQSMVGEELPGGTVAVPEQDRVDEFAGALGVERSPDAPLRGSAEILDRRDRRRGGRKPSPSL
jgi:Family of unknown function (DUF6335)